LLLRRGDAEAEAERSFHHALQVAQGQQARSWELRAGTSLARLLVARHRQDEARSNLAPILAGMTEGFESTDYKEAAALLGTFS
jgi:predicted ATPase